MDSRNSAGDAETIQAVFATAVAIMIMINIVHAHVRCMLQPATRIQDTSTLNANIRICTLTS